MYYLAIDIQHFKQTQKLDPDRAAEISRAVRNCVQRFGLVSLSGSQDMRFMHPRLSAGETEPLLKALISLRSALQEFTDEISGFSILLEALDDEENIDAILDKLLLKIRERNGMYLGPQAEVLLSRLMIGEPANGLWKIVGRRQKQDENIGTAGEFVLDKPLLDSILDEIEPWMNGEQLPGILFIKGEERDGVHLVPRGISQRLGSDECRGKQPFIVLDGDQELLWAASRAIRVDDLGWVDEQLNQVESSCWANKKELFTSFHPGLAGVSSADSLIPEALFDEFLVSFELYLSAYARWSKKQGNVPLVCLYVQRSLSQHETGILNRIMKDCQPHSRIFWCIAGPPQYIDAQELSLNSKTVSLTALSVAEIQKILDTSSSPDQDAGYIHRVTGGFSLSLHQYLNDYPYFREIPPDRLGGYGPEKKEPWEGILQRHLDRLGEEHRTVLYTLCLASPFMDKELAYQFLILRGMLQTRVTEIIKDLIGFGLLLYEEIPAVSFSPFIDQMGYGLSQNRQTIISDLVDFVSRQAGSLTPNPAAVRFVLSNDKEPETVYWAYKQIKRYIENGHSSISEQLIELVPSYGEGRHARTLLQAQISLLSDTGITSTSSELLSLDPLPEGFWRAEATRVNAFRYEYTGNHNQARSDAKTAIIDFQLVGDTGGMRESNILFGYHLLRQQNFQEAGYYFSLGLGEGKPESMDLNRMYAELFTVLGEFIQGKHSRVRAELEGNDGLISRLYRQGARHWTVASTFLLARTYFALGLFAESGETLVRCCNLFHSSIHENMREEFFLWIARNHVHEGNTGKAIEILQRSAVGMEQGLFLAEANVFKGEYETALNILDSVPTQSPMSFARAPYLRWTSGFSWVEDLFFADPAEQGVLQTYRHAMRALCLGKLDRVGESVDIFHWLTRERKVSSNDPHASIILYWYALISESPQARGVERLTLLGRAVKALQERASMIEEPADKREYLRNVVWNSELLDKAKRHNLV